MTLLERILRTQEDNEDKIPIHLFIAACHLWIRRKITNRTQFNKLLGLKGTDRGQMDKIISLFTGKTQSEKLEQLADLDAVFQLLEQNKLTTAQAISILGL